MQNGLLRYLDAEELRKLAGIIDPDGLSSEELEAALSLMDEDGDDEIDFEEFFDWWSGKSSFKLFGLAATKVISPGRLRGRRCGLQR